MRVRKLTVCSKKTADRAIDMFRNAAWHHARLTPVPGSWAIREWSAGPTDTDANIFVLHASKQQSQQLGIDIQHRRLNTSAMFFSRLIKTQAYLLLLFQSPGIMSHVLTLGLAIRKVAQQARESAEM